MADEHQAHMPEARNEPVSGKVMSKEELFATLNASADKTLNALMKAYEASAKKGFELGEEEQLIEILRRAKALREEVRRVTAQPPLTS